MAGPSSTMSNGIVKNGNGKRERVDQEDDQEFMPLSKRINNIHLSPERLVNGSNSHPMHHLPSGHVNGGAPAEYALQNHSHHYLPNGFLEETQQEQVHCYQREASGCHHPDVQTSRPPLDYAGNNESLSSIGNVSVNSSNHNLNHPQHSQVPGIIGTSDGVNLGSAIDVTNYQYRPSLNQSANPHYYEPNRALFDLYIERLLRNNQTPHPTVFNSTLSPSSSNTL